MTTSTTTIGPIPAPADEPRDPDLLDLLERFKEVLLDGIHTTEPGRITAYDPATQLASAQPEIQGRRVEEDGSLTPVTKPAVHRAPVMFLGASAKGRITWPVQAGDACTIYYCSSALARWVTLGRVVDPGDDRRHDIGDAIVAPSVHSAAAVPTDAPTDALVLHANKIKHGGSAATQQALLGNAFLTALDTLIAAIATAVGGITGGSAAGTAITNAKGVFDAAATSYLSQINALL